MALGQSWFFWVWRLGFGPTATSSLLSGPRSPSTGLPLVRVSFDSDAFNDDVVSAQG